MLTDYYAVWQPTKVNTGQVLTSCSHRAFPAGPCSGAHGCWQSLSSSGASSCPGAHPVPRNRRLFSHQAVWSKVWAKGQETTKRQEDWQHMVLPKHPASPPSCLHCGPKIHGLLHSRSIRNLPACSIYPCSPQSWRCRWRAHPCVSPSFAQSARGRTIIGKLKGNQAVSILWNWNYGSTNKRWGQLLQLHYRTACPCSSS